MSMVNEVSSAPTVLGDNLSPWIPVTERLPEDNVPVFVGSTLLGNRHIAFVQDGEWSADIGYDIDEEEIKAITHWMPLPLQPTK